jgi:molecular chaperone DnaJ
MANQDYYGTLGVGEKATPDEIRSAFRKLAKKYHPDRNKGDKSAEEKFKEVNSAYETLSDTKKRAQYDEMRRLGATGVPPGGFRWGGAGGGQPGGYPPPGYDFGGGQGAEGYDMGDIGGGFADIFEQFFGGGRRTAGKPGGSRKARNRGEDVEVAAEIDFETAVRGGPITLTLVNNDVCPTCGGSGAAPGSKAQTCPNCQGRGTVVQGLGGFGVSRTCPQCAGKGTIITVPGPRCHGVGNLPREKQIRLNLKPGTNDGMRIRLKGQGAAGSKGQPAGDLYITFRVRGHESFTRKGNDLYTEVTINAVQAMLGTKVDVRTLEGNLRLTVPAGTQPGRKLRLRGKGVQDAQTGVTGDLYVTVQVTVPRNLSEEDKAKLQEFAKKAAVET